MRCGAGPVPRPTDSGSRRPDAAVVARAGRVRRRRAAVAGGAAMAGLIAAAAFVIGPGSDSVVTTPADSDGRASPGSVDSSVDTTDAPTDARSETAPDQDVTDHDDARRPRRRARRPRRRRRYRRPARRRRRPRRRRARHRRRPPRSSPRRHRPRPTTPHDDHCRARTGSHHPDVLVGRRLDHGALGRRCAEPPGRDTGSRVRERGGGRATRSDQGAVPRATATSGSRSGSRTEQIVRVE